MLLLLRLLLRLPKVRHNSFHPNFQSYVPGHYNDNGVLKIAFDIIGYEKEIFDSDGCIAIVLLQSTETVYSVVIKSSE